MDGALREQHGIGSSRFADRRFRPQSDHTGHKLVVPQNPGTVFTAESHQRMGGAQIDSNDGIIGNAGHGEESRGDCRR